MKMRGWRHLLPLGPCLGFAHSACPEVPARLRTSGGQGAGRGTIVPFITPPDTLPLPGSSHEVAALGWILVYLAFLPAPLPTPLPNLAVLPGERERIAAIPGVSTVSTQLPMAASRGDPVATWKTTLVLCPEEPPS